MNISIIACILLSVAVPAAKQLAQPSEGDEGGLVRVGGSGTVAIVNCCNAESEVLKAAADQLTFSLLVRSKNVEGAWSMTTATSEMRRIDATAAVFVVKDQNLPMSLVAMEAKWGVVNAEGLDAASLRKELLRVAVVVLGGASSKYDASLMRPSFSPADLVDAGDSFTIDTIMMVFPNLAKHGFEQVKTMTYLEACEDGVNPPPANEVQRRIAAEHKK